MITTAIIPAGGIGERFASDLPKQFQDLKGRQIILRSIQLFENRPEIDNIVIPVHSDWLDYLQKLTGRSGFNKAIEIVEGGAERQESVYNALQTKTCTNSDIIIVHDAVRPLASENLIKNIILAAEKLGAVIPALRPHDTLKETNEEGRVLKTIERQTISCVQTPQGYWQEIIATAFENARKTGFIGTDSSSVVEHSGFPVFTIDGEETNIKITTQTDLKIAEIFLD